MNVKQRLNAVRLATSRIADSINVTNLTQGEKQMWAETVYALDHLRYALQGLEKREARTEVGEGSS